MCITVKLKANELFLFLDVTMFSSSTAWESDPAFIVIIDYKVVGLTVKPLKR